MVEEIKNCLHMELPDSVAGKAYTQAKRYCLGLNNIFVEDEKYFKSGEFQDQIECVLLTCDVKNTVHASSVWWRT